MATRDEYHAGQIQYIRALEEIPSDRAADIDAVSRDEEQASALRFAEIREHPEIVDLLRRRGATG